MNADATSFPACSCGEPRYLWLAANVTLAARVSDGTLGIDIENLLEAEPSQ